MGTVSNSPIPNSGDQPDVSQTSGKIKFNIPNEPRERTASAPPQRTQSKRALLGRTLSQAVLPKNVGENIRATMESSMTEAEKTQSKIANDLSGIIKGLETINGKAGFQIEQARSKVQEDFAARLDGLRKPLTEGKKAAKTAQVITDFTNLLTGDKAAKKKAKEMKQMEKGAGGVDDRMKSAEDSIKLKIKQNLGDDLYDKYFR